MKKELLNDLILAVANSPVEDEVAFTMLGEGFGDGFEDFYKAYKQPEGIATLPVVYAMAMYTLGVVDGNKENIVTPITDNVLQIVKRMHTCTRAEMITAIASRETCRDTCRGILRKQNRDNSAQMISKILSNRFDIVYQQFLEDFQVNSAINFRFTGSFVDHVAYSFQNIFLPSHRRDVWETINRLDTANSALDFCRETELDSGELGDFPVGDLVSAIGQADRAMFLHTGHSQRAYGVIYDLVALLIELKSAEKIEQANIAGAERNSKFKFEYASDTSVFYGDPSHSRACSEKGILNKITNATELTEYIYRQLESKKFSLSEVYTLRAEMMRLGNVSAEGNNSPWGDASKRPLEFLDSKGSLQLHGTFDLIVKGVIAADTLLKAMEARGMNVVDMYNKEIYHDFNVIRHLDFLSSFKHVPLIIELQKQATLIDLPTPDHGESPLTHFSGLLRSVIGPESASWYSKHRRQNAELFGLLDNNRLRELAPPESKALNLFKLQEALHSFPRTIDSYRESCRMDFRHWLLEPPATSMLHVNSKDRYYNCFYLKNREAAAHYLEDSSALRESALTVIGMRSMVLTAEICTIVSGYRQFKKEWLGICAPLRKRFIVESPDLHGIKSYDPEKFIDISAVAQNAGWRLAMEERPGAFIHSPEGYAPAGTDPDVTAGLGFTSYLGMKYTGTGVAEKMAKQLAGVKYKQQIDTYIKWYSRLAEVQYSIMDCLKAILHDAYFLRLIGSPVPTPQAIARSDRLLDGFKTGCFLYSDLDSYLDIINEAKRGKTQLRWETIENGIESAVPLNTCMLDLLFDADAMRASDEAAGMTLFSSYYDSISERDRPSVKLARLFATVEQETCYLLLLRDAFDLLVPYVEEKEDTPAMLVNELNSRFSVIDSLSGERPTVSSKCCILTLTDGSIASRDVEECASQNVKAQVKAAALCAEVFNPMRTLLLSMVTESQKEITSMMNYSINGVNADLQKLEACGRACSTCSGPAPIPEFEELRRATKANNAGFLSINNVALTVSESGTPYYIYRNGLLVFKSRDGYEIYQNRGSAAEYNFYKRIIQKAWAYVCS